MDNPNTTLRNFRTSLGLSQADFGAAVGVTGPAICQLELGRTRISAGLALRIGDRFKRERIAAGISVEDLIRGEGDPA